MEQIISGLLRDFEAGKLTRRQLIQALALGVTGPAALAAAQKPAQQSSIPPPRSPAPWKTVWLDHTSYEVSDYRRSTAFYRDLMGWESIHDDGQKQCSMKVGNVGGIIIRNRAGYAGAAGGTNRPTITGLIDHISWGVEPWDTAKVKADSKNAAWTHSPTWTVSSRAFTSAILTAGISRSAIRRTRASSDRREHE
jgi:hypothetical protein